MAALLWCLWPALLLATLAVSHSIEPGSRSVHRSVAQASPRNALQSLDPWAERGYRGGNSRRHGGREDRAGAGPSHPMGRPEDDVKGLGGRSPVRQEVGSVGRKGLARRREDGPLGYRSQSHKPENHAPGSEGSRKGRRHGHHAESRKQGGRRNKARHAKGHTPEPELGSVLKDGGVFEEHPYSAPPSESTTQPSTPALPSDTLISTSPSPVTTAMSEQSPASSSPSASTKPQRFGRGKNQGEVMPTLDMALFDWTDYEDMKPADTWPPTKKKDKWRSKNLSAGNVTVNTDAIEPCDHHLDCLSGSCCDLRHHECRPHNRGLNNKCYDDCMCAEGLRCYAKFHRKRRVTRRKGRCVEPDSANGDQGAFITV
ncbi:draxin-A-like [Megalops cyprinoides]|uniref:draxin-A-like n=1 Tax=Megalops cyprinoides TaxID=118141 RepID=UPI00186514CF|nr:draxin-A-like [Megalops cyprinoides]XP_036387771.1 draxin-A-like [Megalops cyprinoides]